MREEDVQPEVRLERNWWVPGQGRPPFSYGGSASNGLITGDNANRSDSYSRSCKTQNL